MSNEDSGTIGNCSNKYLSDSNTGNSGQVSELGGYKKNAATNSYKFDNVNDTKNVRKTYAMPDR